MSGKVYEIMTKATLAKGTKKTISKHDYLVNDIDKILGCWICNHQYRGVIKQQPVILKIMKQAKKMKLLSKASIYQDVSMQNLKIRPCILK